MMFWYDHGMSGWGWAAMTIGMVLFWAVIIGVGVMLFRAVSRDTSDLDSSTPSSTAPRGRPTPEQLLAERYARGEIDEEEYHRRLDTLHAASERHPARQ